MTISIPAPSLVLLIGTSSAGKSTFARRYFGRIEILSSDFCRGLVSNNETDQNASKDAFEVLTLILKKRLKHKLLTVLDATNIQAHARKKIMSLAKKHRIPTVAIVFDIPLCICQERNRNRPDRKLGEHILRHQREELLQSLNEIEHEGFAKVYRLKGEAEVENITEIIRYN